MLRIVNSEIKGKNAGNIYNPQLIKRNKVEKAKNKY